MYNDIEPWATGGAVTIQRMGEVIGVDNWCQKLWSQLIQRIWRGFNSRGIRYYEKPFPVSPPNRFTMRSNLRLINTSGDYTYELIYLRGHVIADTLPRNTYERSVIETRARDQWKVRCVQTGEERLQSSIYS